MHPRQYANLRSGTRHHASRPQDGPQIAATPRAQTSQGPRAPPADEDTLLSSTQVRARYGDVSAMCIWRWQRNPAVRFPMPDVVITNRSYWRLGTLRRWDAARDGAT